MISEPTDDNKLTPMRIMRTHMTTLSCVELHGNLSTDFIPSILQGGYTLILPQVIGGSKHAGQLNILLRLMRVTGEPEHTHRGHGPVRILAGRS